MTTANNHEKLRKALSIAKQGETGDMLQGASQSMPSHKATDTFDMEALTKALHAPVRYLVDLGPSLHQNLAMASRDAFSKNTEETASCAENITEDWENNGSSSHPSIGLATARRRRTSSSRNRSTKIEQNSKHSGSKQGRKYSPVRAAEPVNQSPSHKLKETPSIKSPFLDEDSSFDDPYNRAAPYNDNVENRGKERKKAPFSELPFTNPSPEMVDSIVPAGPAYSSLNYPYSGSSTATSKSSANSGSSAAEYFCIVKYCDYSSTRAYELKRHMEIHSKTKKYPCEYEWCGRDDANPFSREDHLKEHLRKVHMRDIPKREKGGRKIRTTQEKTSNTSNHQEKTQLAQASTQSPTGFENFKP